MYTSHQRGESPEEQTSYHQHMNEPVWKIKEQRKKFRKKIFGEHYNYNYRKPNQHKMYRIQENRNTEIERQNRILLQKIQGIFKRSMGRKRVPSLQQESEQTHKFVRENMINVKSRRSTQTMNNRQSTSQTQEVKNTQEKRKRIQTQMMLKKVGRINQDDSRVTKKRQETDMIVDGQSKRKSRVHDLGHLDHKVTLFKGERQINNTIFLFRIFVEGPTYSIIAEQKDAKVQEQINMPYEDYKKLCKRYLKNDHANVLDYLHINLDSGLLEFVGFEINIMDVIQYGEVEVIPEDITPKKAPPFNEAPNPNDLTKKRNSSAGNMNINSQFHEKIEEKGTSEQKNHQKCGFLSNLVNLQIPPRAKQQDASLRIDSNMQTESLLPNCNESEDNYQGDIQELIH